MNHHTFVATLMIIVGGAAGCGNSDSASPSDGGPSDGAITVSDAGASDATYTSDVSIPTPAACTTVVKDSDCDKSLRPFVFVHGTYGSGDNFSHVAALLASNGYCADRIVAVEYNSLGDSPGNDCSGKSPQGCGKIDAVINQVLAANPAFTQVDLAGHSQGTSHCGTYLGLHPEKVAHYFNFSGTPDVKNVQTLSLSSLHDIGGHPNHATTSTGSICVDSQDGGIEDAGGSETGAGDGGAPGCTVTQVTFTDQDHFAVAASRDSFIQVYRYLNGKDPQYTDVQCGDDPVTIEGLAETFADNVPVSGKIEVREVSTPRAAGMPEQVVTGDANGHFVATLKRNVFYEFAGYDGSGKLVGYQYFTPFKRTNRLVRFLSPASSSDGTLVGGVVASMTTDKATRSANSSTVIARWSGGAFRQDLGASLKIDGSEVLTSANTGTQAFMNSSLTGGVVGLFMEDKNKNGKSDLGIVDSAPFIAFTDVYIAAKTPDLVDLKLTAGSEDPAVVGSEMVISNWPSSNSLVSVFFQ
jgi:hypothetical protein